MAWHLHKKDFLPDNEADMQADIPHDKRIVLRVQSGPYAGLHQIDGTVSQALALLGEGATQLPAFLPNVPMPPDSRSAPASLVRVTPRYVLYHECAGPPIHRFDEFNPQQV